MTDRLIASVELSMPRTFPKDCVLCEPLADERCSWLQWHCRGCVLGIPVQIQTRPHMKESKQPGNTHKVSVNGTGRGRMWRNSTVREEKWALNGKIEEMARRRVRIWVGLVHFPTYQPTLHPLFWNKHHAGPITLSFYQCYPVWRYVFSTYGVRIGKNIHKSHKEICTIKLEKNCTVHFYKGMDNAVYEQD